MVLPFKSAAEVIPESFVTTIPLPSVWADEITFTGTPFQLKIKPEQFPHIQHRLRH